MTDWMRKALTKIPKDHYSAEYNPVLKPRPGGRKRRLGGLASCFANHYKAYRQLRSQAEQAVIKGAVYKMISRHIDYATTQPTFPKHDCA